MKKDIMGRDLAAPERSVTVNGTDYTLKFSMKAFRIMEDVYKDEYKSDTGITAIMLELTRQKLRAITAVIYGAACAGGMDGVSYEAFEDGLAWTNIGELTGIAMDGVVRAMPRTENSKNA